MLFVFHPQGWSSARKKKIKNRFLSFCDIVLEYTQYEHMKHEVRAYEWKTDL